MTDAELGKAAADRLVHEWPDLHDLEERLTVEFAEAAIGRLAELIRKQPKLFQASRRGSERGAESLSARQFQGLLESLQNADDLGATELRVGLRRAGSQRELLVVHDGDAISLPHVGAMVLPWVSTKADDPTLSGRFGIGQKTLRALGSPIAAHCHPYHFRMDETPTVAKPEPAIRGFYDAEHRDTLLVVPLQREMDVDALRQFVEDLGPQALVFLRTVRRISFTELSTGQTTIDHRLRERGHQTLQLRVRAKTVEAELLELTDPSRGQRYRRYMIEYPLNRDDRRHNKATGPTTTLGVALPGRLETGLLYDRLPLPVPCALPVGLNAQFDPDTARSTLRENAWNGRRFAELGDLLAAAALDTFARKTGNGWASVPLKGDVPEGLSAWLQQRYDADVIAGAQERLRNDLLIARGGTQRQLDEIAFEPKALETVLTTEDQEKLAPGHFAVIPEDRDRGGRWRRVLEELGRSRMIEFEEAFELLDTEDDDELGPREPRWFVDFALATIDSELFDEFCAYAGILLADGERVVPPGDDEPRSLVVRKDPGSLASRLGLALPIHPVYLEADASARKVRTALEEAELLVEAYESDHEALALLARGSEDTVQLDDRALITLRDAFERLSEDDQRTLGPKIGEAIELRGFTYDEDKKRQACWASPSAAYLPGQIDRETDSFARAAGTTRGITWLAPDYDRLLKRSDRRALGPQRFLGRLGAGTFPRLIPPPNEASRYTRDRRPASEFALYRLTEIQATALKALGHSTHLIGDHWSRDLDAVIADIQEEKPGQARRRRAAALLGVLARGWDRHYADRVSAQAAMAYDGWDVQGEVIATWLARAASEEWLPSGTGSLHAPADLHLPTEENRLTVGDKKSAYLMNVDDYILRSPALIALRVRRGPSASSVVDTLEHLRDVGEQTGKRPDAEARTAYRLLALACPPMTGDGRAIRRPVDDLTVAQLRSRFVGGRCRGLILTNGRWYSPKQVFNGPPIFGERRPFVPPSPHLAALWRTLEVPYPDAKDCLDVLRELASAPLSDRDVSVIIETMGLLARSHPEMSPQLRGTLKSLPLWTGREWRSSRPVYAIDDEAVAEVVSEQAPVWQPGFSLDGMEPLLEALDVSYLAPGDFHPVASMGYGAAEGDEWRPRFARAVEHLQSELARRDQELCKTLATSWAELTATVLVIDPDLEVEAAVPGTRALRAPARAHLLRDPLTLFARSAADVASAEAGGQAIAGLFSGQRHTVAWAWVSMWQKAAAGETAARIVLSSETGRSNDDDDRLGKLKTQADMRRRKGRKTGATSGAANGMGSKQPRIRKLKQLVDFEATSGEIVNSGAPKGGVIIPARRAKPAGGSSGAGTPGDDAASGAGSGSGKRESSVLPPMSDREQLAYQTVIRALALDDSQVRDLRNRRGVGADAIDELRQCFEIKMSSGAEIPSEITLTPNEVERARSDPDFFLAVVAGLEEGAGELRVRFIFDPLGRLPLRLRSDLTFGGVREAEALEYRFPVRTGDEAPNPA